MSDREEEGRVTAESGGQPVESAPPVDDAGHGDLALNVTTREDDDADGGDDGASPPPYAESAEPPVPMHMVPPWALRKGRPMWHKYAGKVEWVPSITLKSMVLLIESREQPGRYYRFKKSEEYASRAAADGGGAESGGGGRVRYRCARCGEITQRDFLAAGIAYRSGRGPSMGVHENHAWGDVDANHSVFCTPLTTSEKEELLLRRHMTEMALAGVHPLDIFEQCADALAALEHVDEAAVRFELVVRSLYRRYVESVGKANALPLRWRFTNARPQPRHIVAAPAAAVSEQAAAEAGTSQQQRSYIAGAAPTDYVVIVDDQGVEHTFQASDPELAQYFDGEQLASVDGAGADSEAHHPERRPADVDRSSASEAAGALADCAQATPCDNAACRDGWMAMQQEMVHMRRVVKRMIRRIKMVEDELTANAINDDCDNL